ncbi:MAG: hypothetical protein AAF829_13505 [Pseudomonadota bacterium]
MKRVAFSLAAAGILSVFSHGAHGEAGDYVRQAANAFEQGRFQEAAKLAEANGHADAYAFAARAVLAEAMCGQEQPASEILDRAEMLARAALGDDPEHIEGRLQLAIALSLKARAMSRTRAWQTGYGTEVRDLVEAVLIDDPTNAYAHGFMAVWHVEVVRRGGSIGASIMDASLPEGLGHYATAVELTPDDPGLHWQMARALAAHNPRRHRDKIEAALSAALAANNENALDAVMVRRASVLSQALRTLSANDVKRLARDML